MVDMRNRGRAVSAVVVMVLSAGLSLIVAPSASAQAVSSSTPIAAGSVPSDSLAYGPTGRLQPRADPIPSCAFIDFGGPGGTIHVQTSASYNVQWGITIVPPENSIGRWDVDTYLNSQKQPSSFHRTTTGPYIPHGVLPNVKPGRRFSIIAVLESASGSRYYNAPNECIVP